LPIEEINYGLNKAITEFLEIKEVYTNNNGLTILEKVVI